MFLLLFLIIFSSYLSKKKNTFVKKCLNMAYVGGGFLEGWKSLQDLDGGLPGCLSVVLVQSCQSKGKAKEMSS